MVLGPVKSNSFSDEKKSKKKQECFFLYEKKERAPKKSDCISIDDMHF
jgi:hypothetical protein